MIQDLLGSDDSQGSNEGSPSESDMVPIVLSSDSSDSQSEQIESGNSTGKKRRQQPAQRQSKKKATENIEEDMLMARALAVMEKPNDDLDIFSQFIASEMRQIQDLHARRALKTEIMKILLQYQSNSNNVRMNSNDFTETEYIYLNESEYGLLQNLS